MRGLTFLYLDEERMAEQSYDLIVVGGGPGGYTAAIRATQLGLKTAIVERERLGGICLNWGCIPTKALLKNAEIVQLMNHASDWGISFDNLHVDFSKIIQRSRSVADRLSKGVEFLMKKNNIDYLPGYGRLLGGGRIEIKSEGKPDQIITSNNIILATGARPKTLPGVAIDRKKIISSSEAMNLSTQPKSMIIIGGGAIGVEFSYFYNALGTMVTLIEMMPMILPVEDAEISKTLQRNFKKQGIDILTGVKVEKIRASENCVTVTVAGPEGSSSVEAEVALMAIGVQGNVENLGLEECGVALERGFIKANEHYCTNVEGIHAIGDVIGPPWLAHVASAEGIHCVESIAGLHPEAIDYTSIPGCTYCQPQVASIGLTEEKAKVGGREIKVGVFPFRALGKAVASGETEGFVKLVFDAQYGELLGAHIIGSEASELIMELLIAKRHEATAESILHAIHAHPTMSEAIMEAAAAAMGEAINI
jgi:dihydrolipoamide dehydrogenase